jgi:anaerobic magnesium-protoporphyrin IX monomethyl ester cyclase
VCPLSQKTDKPLRESILEMRRICLINPPFVQYGGVEGQGGKNTPLNLAYLASYVREETSKTEIEIIDAEGLELTLEEIYDRVDAFSPDIVGLTCPTPVYYIVEEICRELKQRDRSVLIVLGGPHPTALPRDTLEQIDADVAVIGEGESTLLELIRAFERNEGFDSILGMAFKQNGTITVNPGRDLISDLDILPFPAKDLLPLEKYYLPPTKRIRSEQATNMVTSRGCPFACSFCMARTIWGRKTRLRSVRNVLDEIQENVEFYGLTEFSFHDELFTFKESRVIELCREILKEDLDITWVCQARAGTVSLNMLKIMKEAGCGKIAFGFESGNQRMLNTMNKKETLKNALESVELCNKAGIPVEGAFILGYPGEDLQSIQDTIDFALQLDCETAAFFIAIPYPGTELYYEALNKGYLEKDTDWRKFAPVSNLESPMVIPNFTPEELQKWKRKAFNAYYLRPSYIFRKLKGLRTLADVKDIMRGLKIFKAVT